MYKKHRYVLTNTTKLQGNLSEFIFMKFIYFYNQQCFSLSDGLKLFFLFAACLPLFDSRLFSDGEREPWFAQKGSTMLGFYSTTKIVNPGGGEKNVMFKH